MNYQKAIITNPKPVSKTYQEAIEEAYISDSKELKAWVEKNISEYQVYFRGTGKDSENWEYFGYGIHLYDKRMNVFTLEYKRGIGHCKKGTWPNSIILKKPQLIDILWCIAIEDCSDYLFEDWCDDLGYDSDSRRAKDIYDACMQNALKFKSIFGVDSIRTLKDIEAIQEY